MSGMPWARQIEFQAVWRPSLTHCRVSDTALWVRFSHDVDKARFLCRRIGRNLRSVRQGWAGV